MIIDLILDRKEGKEYNAKQFYNNVMQYGEIGFNIASALDSGENKDIEKALCLYVVENDYNNNICNYIRSIKWI